MFKIESIIPGIDIFPPDRTESNNGTPSLPNVLLERASSSLTDDLISSSRPSGKLACSMK